MVWTQTQGKYYYHNVNDSCTTWDKPAITYDVDVINELRDPAGLVFPRYNSSVIVHGNFYNVCLVYQSMRCYTTSTFSSAFMAFTL